MRPKCDIILISVNSPVLLGIYVNNKLVAQMKQEGKTSEILPILFDEVMRNYYINRICYANGPGNFSAIKLTHIFLHTLAQMCEIKLMSADSFYFTKGRFINAYGAMYFFKENGEIKMKCLDSPPKGKFKLPESLHECDFHTNCEPLYVLPAV